MRDSAAMQVDMRTHVPQIGQQGLLQSLHTQSRRRAQTALSQPALCRAGGNEPGQQRPALLSLTARRANAPLASPPAAVATEEAQQAVTSTGVPGLGFYTGEDGFLYCDSLRVEDIRQQVPESPFYLYSRDRVTHSYTAYAKVRFCLRAAPATSA